MIAQLNRQQLTPSSVVLALLGVFGALGISRLPYLATEISVITIGAVLALVFVIGLRDPLWALAVGLALGTSKAALSALYDGAFPDFGQVFIGTAIVLWLLQRLAIRDIRFVRTTLMIPLGLFICLGMLSLFSALDLISGVEEVVKWLQVTLIMLIVAERVRSGIPLHNYVIFLGVLVVFQVVLGYWQAHLRGTGPEFFLVSPGVYRAYGTFEQPNPFAGFLGISWPIAFGISFGYLTRWWEERDRFVKTDWLWLGGATAVMLIAIYGMVLAYSRGSWLGGVAAAATMAVLIPRQRALGIAIAGLVLVCGIFAWQNNLLPGAIIARADAVLEVLQFDDIRAAQITDANFSTMQRFAQWQAAIDMARSAPVFGVGLGGYDAAYPTFRLPRWEVGLGHAHNIYLNFLAEAGVIGLLGYIVLWLSIFGMTLRTITNTDGIARGVALGLFGVWMHLTVHHLLDNLYVNNLHIYFGVLLGILAALHLQTKQSSNNDVVEAK